jgi:hypothetical protein
MKDGRRFSFWEEIWDKFGFENHFPSKIFLLLKRVTIIRIHSFFPLDAAKGGSRRFFPATPPPLRARAQHLFHLPTGFPFSSCQKPCLVAHGCLEVAAKEKKKE